MKTIFTSILCLFIQFIIGQKPSVDFNGVDTKINSLIQQYDAVGLAVAVMQNNKVVYSKGFGYRDLNKRLPVTPNTVFHIASMTKAFTGALAGILEGENKLSLKEKPGKYIPNFQFYNKTMDAFISIEDLLSHKSGIGSHGSSIAMFPDSNRLNSVRRLKFLKPQGEIKNSFIYSNMGYTLAGAVIEQASGKSWEESIDEKIFTPLKMYSSYTSLKEMKKNDDYALGYGKYKGETKKTYFENYYSYSSAGAIKSSVRDLSRWMQTWLNKGKFEGQQVIPENYINAATRIQNFDFADAYEADSFLYGEGFGWRLSAYDGYFRTRHGGNTNGFSTVMDLFPFNNIGIVVLANQKSSLLPYAVSDYISRTVLDLPERDFPVIVGEMYLPDKEDTPLNKEKMPYHKLQDFTGSYHADGYGKIEVVLEKYKLYAILPEYKFKITHLQYNTFYFKALDGFEGNFNPEFSVKFTDNTLGEIVKLELYSQSDPIVFKKQELP